MRPMRYRMARCDTDDGDSKRPAIVRVVVG
jgi:hypothetical protein